MVRIAGKIRSKKERKKGAQQWQQPLHHTGHFALLRRPSFH